MLAVPLEMPPSRFSSNKSFGIIRSITNRNLDDLGRTTAFSKNSLSLLRYLLIEYTGLY